MPNESAIILPCAEAEPFVAPLPLQFDRSARLGVPAHITLLYPFLLRHSAENQTQDLVDCRAPARGIDFTEDVVKIAGQQGRYAARHGLSPLAFQRGSTGASGLLLSIHQIDYCPDFASQESRLGTG
jgi:hypothetical protein